MPLYSIQGPDGRTYSIEGPPGATREQVIQAIQARMQDTPQTVTAPPVPQPEQSGFFRQVLDVPVQVSRGMVGGIRMLADVFGAGSSASEALKSADTWLADLLSAQAKNDQRQVAQILKDAEDKGALDQVKAGFQAFLTAPVDTLSQALGSTAPVIIAGLASGPVGAVLGTARLGAVAMPAIGAAMGVGDVKGSIYESVKEAYKQKGASDEVAEAKAQEAQAYSSANLPSMAVAGGLGALAGGMGIEKPLAGMLSKRAASEAAELQALREAERGFASRVGLGAFREGAPEFAQAGQSKLAENIALRNEGFDVPLFQGVFGAAAMEGAAGAVLGGGLSAPRPAGNLLPGQKVGESDADFARRLSREIDAARQREQIPNPLTQPIAEPTAPTVAPTEAAGEGLYRLPDGTAGTLDQAKAYAMSVPPEQRMAVLQQIQSSKITKEQAAPEDLFTQPTGEKPEEKPAEEVKPTEELKPAEEKPEEKPVESAQAVTKEEEEAAQDALQAEKKPEQSAMSGLPVIEAPLSELILSKDVPQFKSDADTKGVVEPLGGTFDRRGVAPIQVWKRNDGRMEVISGRHRLDLARRSGETTIPAQIHEEATGFDAKQAAMLDAELNIRDQQGKVKDYVAYFENAGISEADAESRGLLARAPGKQGFAIATRGSPELVAAHRADVVPDAGAAAIANAAPGDSRLQAVGLKAIQEGKSPLAAVNLIKAVQTVSKDQPPSDGGDLFGFDDSAMKEAEDMARIATLKQNQIAQRLAAISGASRRPEIAKKEGIDIKDPEALKKREKELRQQKAAWDNWTSSSDLVEEIRKEMAPAEKASVREAPEPKKVSPEIQAKIDLLGKALTRIMSRYGLKDVALKLIADMQAECEYSSRVLSLALDATDPVSALRHESIHAMKELGFFTDQQWKSLERQAKEKWIDQYLKQKDVNRQPLKEGQTSRYDAYMRLYGGDEEAVIEEAIADAFADFDATKAPPGMLQALLKKVRNFFQAIKEAFGAEPDAERIFRKAERGELRGREVAPVEEQIKPSLREVPLSTRGLMESAPVYAMAELGLKTTSEKKPGGIELFNDVRSIATALNQDTIARDGAMKRGDTSSASGAKLARAMADEIAYQVGTTTKTGTGLGWYSSNYPKSVQKLAKRFPELERSEYARTVFSALVAITSNGEKVAINVKNAIRLYADVRDGKELTSPGSRRDAAMENNLAILKTLMDKYGPDLRAELMREITVKDMNAALRQMGEKPDSSYLADTKVPASALYFGPKLGAFFSNLEGAEGYLTMDLWWTRTINRMRGLLIPKATPNSINNFRAMMDQPNATREEVVSATIPLKQKYEQQNFTTELEFLVAEKYRKDIERQFRGDEKRIAKEVKKVTKEPSTKSPNFDEWHRIAKKMAGPAYQQLLFEHKLEKLANTIHKNEYEMLKEDPFTASDRAFMYRTARYAQRLLKQKDIDLSLADIQAALWYYEKRLYQHLSGRKADDIGYDEAITQLAGQSTGPAGSSVVFDGQPVPGAGPAGAGTEAGGVRGKPAEQPRLSLRTNIFDEDVIASAINESKKLDGLLGNAIETDVQGVIPGKQREFDRGLDRGYFTEDQVRKAFTKTLSLIREKHGDQLTLWRSDVPDADKSIDTRTVFMADKDVAEKYAVNGREAKPYQVKTDDVLAVYARPSGYYEAIVKKPDIRYNLRDQTDPATRARIDQTTTPREEKTFIQRITEAIFPKSASHFRAMFLNRYNRLGEYDKELVRQMGGAPLLADSSAEAAALMSDMSAGVLAAAMGVHDRVGGIPVYINGRTEVVNNNNTVKGPLAIFAPLAKYNDPFIYQKYQFWAAVNRGLRLYGQGRDPKFITPADQAEAAKILQDHPEFDGIQKEWIEFNNGLVKYLLDTGVLTEDAAKEFVKYSDYIPFYRQIDGEQTVGPQIFASLAGVKPPKKTKGSEAPLGEFLETVIRNVQYSIEAGMKNAAAQKAVNVAQAINQVQRLNYVSSAPNVVKILEKGKATYYSSQDPLFIDALKSLNLGDLPFIGLLSAPANLLRSLVTKDPAFMLANMMRDSMSAWVSSGVNMTPLVDTLTNFGKALRGQNPEYAALLNSGVIGGYDYSQGVEISASRFNRELRKEANVYTTTERLTRPFTSLWDALEKGTTASDAATRMEIYKKTLAETKNETEAIFRALEVMNFNRKGNNPMVRVLTAAVPFLNARMQGLDVMYRAAFAKGSDIDPKEVQKRFFVRGMTIAALSTMYWMLASDDDEWKRQEQETRDNYWLIPSLKVKIPIPFEIGVLFKVIPERILEYSFGDDTGKDFMKSMTRQLMNTLAFNPIPQTALPVIEYATNFSFFTTRPIVSQGLEDVAPAYQVGPTTSRLSQLIGGATKDLPTGIQISPVKLDQLINGYTGTIGGYMVDLFDAIYDMNSDAPKATKRFEQMPVIKRFLVDPQARGQVTAFYELKNSVDEAVRTVNLLERNMQPQEWGEYFQENKGLFAVKDYVLDLEKSMKQYREMKNFVRAANMDADQKGDIILNITTLENQLASNIQQIKKMSSGQ